MTTSRTGSWRGMASQPLRQRIAGWTRVGRYSCRATVSRSPSHGALQAAARSATHAKRRQKLSGVCISKLASRGGNASAARRTFAVRLHRDGRSLKLIQELIGVSSLSAVKNLIDGDPERLSAIVEPPSCPCATVRLTLK